VLVVLSCAKHAAPEQTNDGSVASAPWCAPLIEARDGVVLGTAHVKLSGDRELDEPAAPALCTTSDVQHWLVPRNGVVFAACTREGLIELTMTDRALGPVDFSKGEWGGSNTFYNPDNSGQRSERPQGQRNLAIVNDPTKLVEIGAEHTKVRTTYDGGAKPLLVEVDWTCRFAR
jgi:hypothetical protein